jgi:O-antigen/teichoic acid export membrane protein
VSDRRTEGSAAPEGASADANPFTVRSVRRRLLEGSAWVFGARAASLVLGVVIASLLGRLLTTEELGVYASSFTLALIGSALAKLGLDRAVIRFVAGALGTGEPGRARSAIRIAVGLGSAGAVALGVFMAAGPGQALAREVFHSPALAAAIPLAAGWLIAIAIQSLTVESFRGLSAFSFATIFDALIVDSVSAATFAAIWVAGIEVGARGVIAVSAAATALAAGIGMTLLFRRMRSLEGPGGVAPREMLHVGWPLMFTNLAILFLGSGVDLLILGAFEPQSEVGLYAAASRLVVFVVTPFVVFSGVIPPIIAELHAQGKMRQLERALRAGATLAGIPSFAVLLVFLLFGPWVLEAVWSKPIYREAAPILIVLSLGRLIAVWAGSAGVTLMMTGYQRAMMVTTLLSAALSVGAGIVGAAAFGAIGVAVATASAQILQNTMQLVIVHRRLGVWTMIHLSPGELYRYLRPHGRSGEAAEDAAEQVAEVLVQAPDDDAVPPGAGGAQSETEPGEESP